MAQRIDNLEPGTEVTLFFHGEQDSEPAVFLGLKGEGDSRHAKFRSEHGEWEAYRYNGRWAYGTGADRLQLL